MLSALRDFDRVGDHWSTDRECDPERFSALDASLRTAADEARVSFGRGPRICLGFALAQVELTLILSRLAKRLDIRATSNVIPEPVGMIVSQPLGGAPMLVRPHAVRY